MADTKSKAQELADALEAMRGPFLGDGFRTVRADEIAAKLRRLDAVEKERDALQAEVERLRADADRMTWLEQAAALLVSANDRPMRDWLMARPAGAGNLRAAIDAARGAS